MLKNWTSHAEYQQFIISNLSNLNKINSKRILELESSISKSILRRFRYSWRNIKTLLF